MDTFSVEINLKELLERSEDPIDGLMFEESFYEEAIEDWLENMRPW